MADSPMTGAEMTDALANWPAWVADGRASVQNSVLCIIEPEMMWEEWEARFVTAH